MTHTTRVRIFPARSIVAASRLDCLPTRKRSQQLAHQRRLPNVGSVAADTDDEWPVHSIYLRRLPPVPRLGAVIFKTPRASLLTVKRTSFTSQIGRASC